MYTNDDFFREIGHISVFFATLDLFVSQVLVELTGTTPFGENDTLGRKLRLLKNLKAEDVSNAELLATLQAVLPRAEAASAERNRYIHDLWIFEPALILQGRIRRAKPNYPLKARSIQELSIQDLQVFKVELGELQKIFATAMKGWKPA